MSKLFVYGKKWGFIIDLVIMPSNFLIWVHKICRLGRRAEGVAPKTIYYIDDKGGRRGSKIADFETT